MLREASLRAGETPLAEGKVRAHGNEISTLFLAYLCTCGTKCMLSCCRLSSDMRVGRVDEVSDILRCKPAKRANMTSIADLNWILNR